MSQLSVVTLSEISESINYGYTASATEDPIGPKFLRITDIVPDSIEWRSVPYCQIDDETRQKYSLVAGDIVIARTGATVGYAKMIRKNVDAVFASYLVRFRIDRRKADWRYVGKLVESTLYKAYVLSQVGGAAQPNANAQILGGFKFKLPSQKVQDKIACILCNYDDLIENNRKRIALLEDAAREIYKEWFVRLRFPGYENAEIINGMPEGWEKRTAIDLMQVMSGGTPKTTIPDYWDGEIPFYTPKDSTVESYVIETEKTITTTGLANCNSRLYPKDTIFITARGTVGNLNMSYRPMAMNQSCYALVGKPGYPQKYLFCMLKDAVQHFKQHASGAVFDAIVVDTFKLIPVVVPCDHLVQEFERIAQPIYAQVGTLLEQNIRLSEARDILLPRLMSGEIEV